MTTQRVRNRSVGPFSLKMTKYVDGVKNTERDTQVKLVTEEMHDTVVSDFGKRRNAGDIINNPMNYVKSSIQCTTGGSSSVTQSGKVYTINGQGSLTEFQRTVIGSPWYQGKMTLNQSPDVDLEAAVKLQALGNLDRSPYSFAEDIAEMRETLRFLRDPLLSLKKLSEAMRDHAKYLRTVRGAMDHAKIYSDVWLQYRFALSPLVRSMSDLIESFHDKTQRPERRTARGKRTWTGSDSGIGKSRTYYKWEGTVKEVHEHKAGILYEVSNPLNDWRFKYGLRFKDIPETLWAIFPYSFMVDRMWNFSQSMRGLSSFLDPNVKILAAWHTKKVSKDWTLSYVDYTYPSASAVTIVPDVRTVSDFEYNRVRWEPSISDFIPPMEKKGLIDTSTKLADLGALILQAIKLR